MTLIIGPIRRTSSGEPEQRMAKCYVRGLPSSELGEHGMTINCRGLKVDLGAWLFNSCSTIILNSRVTFDV